MQNIQSYGGPLPLSWIESHIELGRQIINRQLELGMQPIQQGFSGYVPREMRKKFPKAKISKRGGWCGFQGAAQLDPTDPLFLSFGRDFLEEEKKLFGAHGVYAADPFHEGKPPLILPSIWMRLEKRFTNCLSHSTRTRCGQCSRGAFVSRL